MSTANHPIPQSMTELNTELDTLTQQLLDLRGQFIGASVANTDYVRTNPPANIENVEFKTCDKDPVAFECVVFGELQPSTLGTKICAAGNHIPLRGKNFKAIRDGSSVKDVHVLRNLSISSPATSACFQNQLSSLNTIHLQDDSEDKALGKVPTANYDWVKASGLSGRDIDCIIVNMGNKYTSPSRQRGQITGASRVTAKVDIQELLAKSKEGAACTSASTSAPIDAPDEAPIEIGNLYDPSVQPDFGGKYFELNQDKLVQLDIRDIDGNLIHPKDMYNTLRPGTLMLYHVQLLVYNIKNSDDVPGFRRFYKLLASSARVLRTSNTPAEIRTQPYVPKEYWMQSAERNAAPPSSVSTKRAFDKVSLKGPAADRVKRIATAEAVARSDTVSDRKKPRSQGNVRGKDKAGDMAVDG